MDYALTPGAEKKQAEKRTLKKQEKQTSKNAASENNIQRISEDFQGKKTQTFYQRKNLMIFTATKLKIKSWQQKNKKQPAKAENRARIKKCLLNR